MTDCIDQARVAEDPNRPGAFNLHVNYSGEAGKETLWGLSADDLEKVGKACLRGAGWKFDGDQGFEEIEDTDDAGYPPEDQAVNSGDDASGD